MNCDYIFELKDKNKILSKFSRNIELFIDDDKRVFVCCSGKVLTNRKCKRHIEKECIIDIRSLKKMEDISEMEIGGASIRHKIKELYVSATFKSKAEKILNILSNDEKKKNIILSDRIISPERSSNLSINIELKPDIKTVTEIPRPLPRPESNNSSDTESILDFDTDTDSDSDSEVELEVIKCEDGEEILVNDKLEVIELDPEGFGNVVGKLELFEGKSSLDSNKLVKLSGIMYKVRKEKK